MEADLILADTNIIIEVLKNNKEIVAKNLKDFRYIEGLELWGQIIQDIQPDILPEVEEADKASEPSS